MTENKKESSRESKDKVSEDQSNSDNGPMGMGMGMAKKMMGKMDKDAPDPMAMKKKMMGKKPSKEGKPPENPMMQMCQNMLGTIKQTNEMALHATPELQGMFTEWIGVLEDEAMVCLAKHPEIEVSAMAAALKISKESAIYLVSRLSIAGKVSLTCHSLSKQGTKAAKFTKEGSK